MTDTDLYASIAASSAIEREAPLLLVSTWARLCEARGVRSLTAHEVVAYAYGPDVGATGPLRAALEHVAGSPPGVRPEARHLGTAMRRRIKGLGVRLGDPGGLVRLVVDGKSGGRARWRVETVPAYVPGSASAAHAALVERLRAEEAKRP